MTFPSRVGGSTTQQVGFFACDHTDLAEWLADGLDPGWSVLKARWESIDDALEALEPIPVLSRYGCIGLDGWTLMMTNGPMGTDVGVLPSYAARELKCRGIRAVRVDDDEPGYPARILEVYGPRGEPPLALERSVVAANDGGRWVFETSGTAFGFEDQEAYKRRAKTSRLTGELLHNYLLKLGVPVDSEPDWSSALLVQKQLESTGSLTGS
ncbi:MAG: hypothetical protein AAF219_11570 [Myxococcota bacterium]